MKYQIGDFLYNTGRSGEAKRYFRTLVNDNKLNTEPAAIEQYLIGEVYDKDGDYDNARLEYPLAKGGATITGKIVKGGGKIVELSKTARGEYQNNGKW